MQRIGIAGFLIRSSPYPRAPRTIIVKGSEKVAPIDTVNPGFAEKLEEKIAEVAKTEEIDFIIMNHTEPDHAGAIPYLLKKNTKVQLICTEKGSKMASVYYSVPAERIRIVRDHESIDPGGKKSYFTEAPFLHWPETRFNYLEEDSILFPCDFLEPTQPSDSMTMMLKTW